MSAYIEGIVGWKCPVCASRHSARKVVCNCGESHRPVEIWLRREHELEGEVRALRFWLVFAVAAFVAAAGIALAAWCVAFRDVEPQKAQNAQNGSKVFSYPVGRVAVAAVPGAAGFICSPAAHGQEEAGEVSACAAPSGVEKLFSRKGAKAQGGAA